MGNTDSPSPKRVQRWPALSAVPLWLWLSLAGFFGGIVGLGAFTFAYAEGGSYLSNDPAACVNCHIMREVYDGWNHGTHKAVATCNDCHTPHTFPAKYLVKGINGWNHSLAFTMGNFPEPIRITDQNRGIAQGNCLYCHGDLVSAISHEDGDDPTNCLTCHAGVGHGP
ncbi:MAG: cytochrome c nitrite reductase small subunit [Ardenticatenaceae bacterium]|nr:cytochrome c nitrite reductase small subunit [Anaerolineales bacterium]MCB8917053.1 cytochrome c nitrite reductase small subunit [Ardenticatenaceae bacterium]